MPIKFRCEHCRQFLGISHLKAGKLVDCPTCGRTIRVPNPEGDVEPIPELKLNLKDAKLATALDELATLGKPAPSVASESEPPPESREPALAEVAPESPKSSESAKSVEPVKPAEPAASEAVPVVPPVVATPIKIEPLLPAKPIPIVVPDRNKPVVVASMNELATLAARPMNRDLDWERPVIEPDGASSRGQRVPRGMPHSVATLASWLISATLLGFVLGFMVGRWDRSRVNVTQPRAPNDKLSASNEPRTETKTSSTPAMRGQITFQTEAGEIRPDRGARVVLLPETRQGSAKLPVIGFRASDNEADGQVAAAALKALGGDVAVVNEQGAFEIPALKPGTYRVLALSHFQRRDDRQPLDSNAKSLLDSFFDKPDQLLGKCRYHVADVKIQGSQTVPWNFQFDRE